jgi:hypothetical protein
MRLGFEPRSSAKRLLAALLATALGGCSVFNPHVESTIPRPAFGAGGEAVLSADSNLQAKLASRCGVGDADTERFAGGMSEAVCYVNGYRTAYKNAVGNDALLRNVTGTVLIPVSAAALYLGLTNNDATKSIAALALSGASLFGLSSFLQSTPRQKVYMAGSQAMGCALLAMRPFMLPQSEYGKLVDALGTLYTQINITSDRRNEVKRTLSSPEADAAVSAADELIAEARQTFAAGSKLRRETAAAGFTLTVAADNIADKVDILLIDTEPDLNSLLGITANLGTTAAALAPGPLGRRTTTTLAGRAGIAPQTKPSEAVKTLEASELEDLRAQTSKLRADTDAVGVIVNEAAVTADLQTTIEGCKVEPAGGSLVVQPADPQQTMEAGKTKRFAVYGGSGVPRAALIGDTLPGADIKPGIQDGTAVFDLGTTKEGGPGTLTVAFSDATGQSRTTIRVTVEGGQQPPLTGAVTGNAGVGGGTTRQVVAGCPARTRQTLEQGPVLPEPISQDEAALAGVKTDVQAIQRALNHELGKSLTTDGDLGRATLLAVGDYQEKMGKPQKNFCLDKALADELKAKDPGVGAAVPIGGAAAAEVCKDKGPPLAGAQSDFEKSMTCDQLLTLKQAMGMPAKQLTAAFDDDLRKTVRIHRNGGLAPHEPGVADDAVTQTFVAAITNPS